MLSEVRITVEKVGEKRYRSRVENILDKQEICRNDFEYDPELLVHIEAQNWLEKGTLHHELEAVRDELEVILAAGADPIAKFGQRLYGYLFGKGGEFAEALRLDPRLREGRVRLNLALDPEAAVLWSVPWEYLHDSDGFLTLSGRFLLNRVPWTLEEISYEVSPRPLRILIAIAGPTGEKPLNQEREIELIQEALDEAQGRQLVKMDFLNFATWDDLREALSTKGYHVLHFTGHGNWDERKELATLAFENDEGKTDPVTLERLIPLLTGRELRLVVLSSCKGAKTSNRDAFIGMGTGLLKAGVPAVLAMQSSILDESAIEMARAFYTALGQGHCLEEALWEARQAMRNRSSGPGSDWGLPTLYLRTHEMRLIDPQAPVEEETAPARLRMSVGGLPLPRGFVGRREEQRAIKWAVEERVPFLFIRGIGGVGKTALAAKAIAKLDGQPIDSWMVVDCKEERKPLADVLSALANLLRGRGTLQTEMAEMLLDSRRDLTDRVGILAQNLPQTNERLLFIFDNLEKQLQSSPTPGSANGDFADPEWREFFATVFKNNWTNATWLITSRFRPQVLDVAAQGNRLREFHLKGLEIRYALMFMGNLPHLRGQPIEDKVATFKLVGGHPHTIMMLDGWVGQGGSLKALLADPSLRARLAEEWESYFLDELLARLREEERRVLEAMSVWRGAFWKEMVEWMAPEGEAQGTVPPLERWHELSLVQLERVDKDSGHWYSIHPVVREYLLGSLTQAQCEAHHLRAAEYYQECILRPYRDQIQPTPTPEQEPEVARDVLRQLAHQTENMNLARWAVDMGLAWREHLFAARRYEEAGDIVEYVVPVLFRWGQRDLAKVLLRDSIATLESANKAVAQGNLATLLKDEGKLDEALEIYEATLPIHEKLEGKQQMATALGQIGIVHQHKGDYDRAIEAQQASLEIRREIKDGEGQAISLHQLSILYMLKEDYDRALETSKKAEALARKLHNDHFLAATLHEQGHILNRMRQPKEAFARFQESLVIHRRIGEEAGAAASLNEIGKMLTWAERYEEAIKALSKAQAIYRSLGIPQKVATNLTFLGQVHEAQGEIAAALEKYEQALALDLKYGSPRDVETDRQDIARVREKLESGEGRQGE